MEGELTGEKLAENDGERPRFDGGEGLGFRNDWKMMENEKNSVN